MRRWVRTKAGGLERIGLAVTAAIALGIPGALAQSSVNLHEPLGPSSRKTPIVISEIMYKPAPRADTNNLEYVEIYNSNPWFHDLSGYQIVADNLSYTFPPGTILSSNAFLVVAASPGSMTRVYGITNVLGPYTGSLKKSGTIQLLDEVGAVLLTVPYDSVSPWPMGADGTGHSIVLGWPSYGEGDPRAWDISDVVGGSPGQSEGYVASALRNVMIDEFLAHTDLPDVDYIKLYNHSTQAVDVSGCILTDDPLTNKFVIPSGTTIPARGFVYYTATSMNFALNAAGESIFFINPGRTRVLDAVTFDAQENGVSMGRWPDGASQFYRLAAKQPATKNAAIRISQVVINELMYHPISGNDDDQYVELYNRGTNQVDLSGWTLADAISFTFPGGTVLATNGYLVIARNAARLRANYSNLNLTNCLGDFSGKLSGSGERLALTMPDTLVSTNGSGAPVTNTIHITVDEITYQTGGRWGQWSDGGGSSLERTDPHANSRLAANWADSDETQKSAWTNIEVTGVLDNGTNYSSSIGYAQLGLLDVGECLVDNVEVRSGTSGVNLVANSDFESGLGNWSLQGCFIRSSQENSGYGSSHSLHVRGSDSIWTGVNSCQATLNANSLASGQTATLRFKARWLHGWPEVLLRLNGNWLEAAGTLPVPANLGTPGLPNSRYLTNSGPAIYEVVHAPTVPAANQAVVVTARAHDPDGLQSLKLNYRIDPSSTYTTVTMNDAGTNGDAVAGDGLFSATIPGQASGKIAAFYISAADSNTVTARFPALVADNAPVHECLVMFGDGNPGGSFGVYHLWISSTNVTIWANASELSNESHDGTFVNNSRVIYNMQGRFAGSPWHQLFDSPSGALCHYKWTFPDDDKFLGATSFNKI
ncbi:MAG TPA: lamin tail domain-containing protein, partial [Candidatus Acidoferrum sp.]|nr:lamin tail domain-containing protein [Candidatus Acidoferrum sp.]